MASDILLAAKSARIAYETPGKGKKALETLGFDKVSFVEAGDTQAYIARHKKNGLLVVAFRGTEPTSFIDWINNLRAYQVNHLGGKIHKGLWTEYKKARREIKEILSETKLPKGGVRNKVVFTGHSKGAGLATLAAADFGGASSLLVTFGSLRVGNGEFVGRLQQKIHDNVYRYVHNTDIVPRTPPKHISISKFLLSWDFAQYRDVGKPQYIDSQGYIYNNPSALYMLIDRLRGRWNDFSKTFTGQADSLGTKGIKDHFMDTYLEKLTDANV